MNQSDKVIKCNALTSSLRHSNYHRKLLIIISIGNEAYSIISIHTRGDLPLYAALLFGCWMQMRY